MLLVLHSLCTASRYNYEWTAISMRTLRNHIHIKLLIVDDTFRYESVMLTINTLVVDLTKYVKEDVEFFQFENI